MNSPVPGTYFFLSTYMLSKWDVDLGVPGFQIVTKAGNKDEITMERCKSINLFYIWELLFNTKVLITTENPTYVWNN